MSNKKRIMIGVADVTSHQFFPYYAKVEQGSFSVEQLAARLAKQCFKSKKFVYASFPQNTKWATADKKFRPIWKEHKC